MSDQKFHRGDLVRVAKDLGPSMAHFNADSDAIVLGSYKDQYGGSTTDTYTLDFRESGSCSWYDEHQLTMIESGRHDLLQEWEQERQIRDDREGNLNWIFDPANREIMLLNPPGASILGLAKCLNLTGDDMWGRNGEGITYYINAMAIRAHAQPYLERSSNADWLQYCAELMKRTGRT